MSQKRKLEVLLDKQIERKLQELEYWQKQRQKLVKNRNIKRKLEKRLTQKLAKEEELTQMITNRNQANNTSSITSSNQPTCLCVKSKMKSKKKNKKKKKKNKGYQMNCFTMTKGHWKNPPYWTGPDFTACTNTANSTYWCLRTINSTHNFLYCEYWTSFVEYFDLRTDPYQLYNKADNLTKEVKANLNSQLEHMRSCKGAKGCFLKAGQSFSNRRDMLRKWRRYERKKRHGLLIRGPADEEMLKKKLGTKSSVKFSKS